MSTKHRKKINATVATTLWIRAGGRCQFPGCNKILYQNDKTLQYLNQANLAHIKAYNKANRWDENMPEEEKNNIENLMLLCYDDHKVIDDKGNEVLYDVETLSAFKKDHEDRIELYTALNPEYKSHIVYFGAKIGSEDSSFSFRDGLLAMTPKSFPTSRNPIHLGFTGGGITDKDDAYWDFQLSSLQSDFDAKVKPLLQSNDVKHLSIFGLAPQPLLIMLGAMLTELHEVDIYQKSRIRKSWKWDSSAKGVKHVLYKDVDNESNTVALNLSLSAQINNERITSLLGSDINVYRITHDNPSNTYLEASSTLEDYAAVLRGALDKIKYENPNVQEIHVFPAMPVSAAISTGRVRMPKADLPFIIYEENRVKGGFYKTFKI